MRKRLPSAAQIVADRYPEIWRASEALGEACYRAGPLDGRVARLVKLALAIGSGSEGAVHSHVRRGYEEGLSVEDVRHVALLALHTIGFPRMVAALTWVDDVPPHPVRVLRRRGAPRRKSRR